MVCVGDGRVVYGDVPGHPLAPLLAAVAALAGARPVHSQVGPGHLHQNTNKSASAMIKFGKCSLWRRYCIYEILKTSSWTQRLLRIYRQIDLMIVSDDCH